MPAVIFRHFETLFFVMMNMTEKCPTVGAIFHLHFQVLKNILKKNHSEFLQNKYFDGVHKSVVFCIHTAF